MPKMRIPKSPLTGQEASPNEVMLNPAMSVDPGRYTHLWDDLTGQLMKTDTVAPTINDLHRVVGQFINQHGPDWMTALKSWLATPEGYRYAQTMKSGK